MKSRSTLDNAVSGSIQDGARKARTSGCPFARTRRQLSSADLARMPADEYHSRVMTRMQRGNKVAKGIAVAAAGAVGGGSSGEEDVVTALMSPYVVPSSAAVPVSAGSAGLVDAVAGHQAVMPTAPLEHCK